MSNYFSHLTRSIVLAVRNLGLRTKVFILIVPVAAVVGVFAENRISEKIIVSREMEQVQRLTAVAVLSSSLIHELQKERGLGALYLSRRANEIGDQYSDQALVTNSRIAVLNAFLQRFDVGEYDREYSLGLERAFKKLANLSERRREIRENRITVEEELVCYTSIIDSLLRSIATLVNLSPSAEIRSLVNAYVNLLEYKERFGRERAVIATVYGRGRFAGDQFRQFVALQGEKAVLLAHFRLSAAPADLEYFDAVSADPLVRDVEELERSFLDHPDNPAIFAAGSDRWWRLASGQIDLLNGLEDRVSVRLSNRADALKSDARLDMLLYVLGTLVMAAAMVLSVLLLHRSIVRPILELSGQMSHLDVHKLQQGPVDRYDEIGLLYQCFYDMSGELRARMEGLEDAVKERTEQLNVLNNKLSKFLSPQLYQKIFTGKHDVTLTHTRKKLTVFFSDIVDFTGTTERMDPEELSSLLNFYLEEMSVIVDRYEGTIDKFIGDAVMVFFGDPEFTSDREHALRCVRMAREMLRRLDQLHDDWTRRGIASPFKVRIGINTGYCTVGNFGSENRMDYTIIGNQVNLASRLQSKARPNQILISRSTHALVKEEVACRDCGPFDIKGFDQPIQAFEVLDEGAFDDGAGSGKFAESGAGYRIELNPGMLSEEERRRTRRLLKEAFLRVSTEAERERILARRKEK